MSTSTTTSTAPVSMIRSSMTPMSSGRVTGRVSLEPFLVVTVTSVRVCTRVLSAPAASSRGLTVSSRPSSAVSSTDGPLSRDTEPSGIGCPVLSRAIRSTATVDLPTPGSPSSMISLPLGR